MGSAKWAAARKEGREQREKREEGREQRGMREERREEREERRDNRVASRLMREHSVEGRDKGDAPEACVRSFLLQGIAAH